MKTELARLGGDLELEYALLGEPSQVPLLLLRPLGGSMALWGSFASDLAAARRVIVFNPRGVGGSSALGWGTTTREMAADALLLLDFLGVESADVFGESLGGMVATWLAVDAPERVRRLVLASTLARAGLIGPRLRSRLPQLLRALLEPPREVEAELVNGVLSPAYKQREPGRVRALGRYLRRHGNSRANLLRLSWAALRHDASASLARISSPTLLLFGSQDPIAGASARDELSHTIVGSKLEVVPASGHDLSLEKPREVAELTLGFLSS